jgi:hypothetical protein
MAQVKKLKDVTAELNASTDAEDKVLTPEEVDAYRNILDVQRMELDLAAHTTYIALDVIRTLTSLIQVDRSVIGYADVADKAASKIIEAINQIGFGGE